MKYLYTTIALICCSVLFLSNTENEKIFNFTIDGDKEPILPEVPYEYGGFEFPSYLKKTVGNVYYDTVPEQTIIFEDVTDEISTLGRVLFYDELLSANENLSCATCHKQEFSFAESVPFSEGVDELTARNSMQLNDIGWSNNFSFFWDMSHSDLKEMIVLPLTHPNEIGVTNINDLIKKMESTTYYSPLFEDAFGDDEITLDRIKEGLRQFLTSLNTFNSKYDRVNRNEDHWSTRESSGLALFSANCANCHWNGTPQKFVEKDFPDNLIEDRASFVNRLNLSGDGGAGDWNSSMKNMFKVPTLRNWKYSAPYMHDGRFTNIDQVIEHYSEDATGGGAYSRVPHGGYKFTDKEKRDIKAFLNTLNDETFATEVKWSDPFNPIEEVPTSTTIPLLEQEVSVFPNPSNGLVNVTFDNIGTQQVDAYLVTMEGKLLRKFSTHRNGFQTDVSQLPVGTYIVRIKNGDGFINKKLIVK